MKADDLQRALYSKLTGDVALMSLIKGVYADVEQPNMPEKNTDFPYVTIGNDQLTRWDTKTTLGANADCQIDIWSRQNNLTEAKAIGTAIYSALHYQNLTISGANDVLSMVDSMTFSKDPDGQTKRGLILFNVKYDGV